ncbi:(2Fe-2S)-binding protein [Fibrisoma montanum]|uniref:(2Fe-2S)-binding protein n=1 Tax=Fibrisoma montanum TaxID=2305895 RepID=A0A418LVV0_9BACT|nr:(2Fe-2S)-binding protein [Fibrisoma montanum]RIV17367.1 (2Fe-2S)-binding protein [Fibrisoma montanum]
MKHRTFSVLFGNEQEPPHTARRDFLKQSSLLTALALAPSSVVQAAETVFGGRASSAAEPIPVVIEINGTSRSLSVEPRVTLLDLLREQLDMTGTKKGCDYGQCGACTVHVDGQRVLACLSLAVMMQGRQVTTIEGLAENPEQLHPMQEAFIRHDGFQCGYCTPGQIMSAVGCIREGHADSAAEIREYMSGNLCRCGAYSNIIAAIEEVKKGGAKV